MKTLIWKTFNEWSRLGFLIVKGSRASLIDGKLKFNNKQINKKTVYEREEIRIDYTQDAEFWAKVNPNALYWYLVDYPQKNISKKAGAILANNIY